MIFFSAFQGYLKQPEVYSINKDQIKNIGLDPLPY